MRTAAFHNLGCRVNAYETEAMTEQLKNSGYRIVPFEEKADVYIVNTCTVTAIADRKSRQMLHRAKEQNPGAVIVAAGCYAQDGKESLLLDDSVDLLVGNSMKSQLSVILDRWFSGERQKVYNEPIADVRTYDELPISETEGRSRAFLKIQDGCNQFCSYCRIPYVRGRIRSRNPEEVLLEAKRLAAAGFSELILTGIHLSSYGRDFDGDYMARTGAPGTEKTNVHLLAVLREIAAVPEVVRIRMGSLEPAVMTEEFVRSISQIPEICPQFHLSLQSGCDRVLARMNRRYTTGEYEEICERLRRYFPDPAITTDVIVGFPGETEGEFLETLAFVRRIEFAKIHIFKYSIREGTKAAGMPGQVEEAVKKRRSAILSDAEFAMRMEYAMRRVGTDAEALFEEKHASGAGWIGHTREMLEAVYESEEDMEGRIRTFRVTKVLPDGMLVLGS
ncbi:MAG: tRNA (N(6)-L-threonylcarbamoyladenosine(37)-C(2))-methylthiotransferase MtaB [Lachnospiraceae bacterium]|nr:tRNA (N(6)-L-threonylcarbamoyladenosine(37)-C(2))-methylthiotransferase MtaB [Lachnospiraceae bacterium]